MVSPYELVNTLTVDEFIGLCSQIDGKFVVEELERDENLDVIAFVRLENKELQAIKVQAYGKLQ